jgi:hypothetical protein
MKRLSIKHILVTLLAMVGMIPPVVANNLPSITSLEREPVVYSPQVASMIRYDHTRVNQNTGCINQRISLVNFLDKDFDFPISISYTSQGFRPQVADNYVGRDWMLDVGGIIYRKVNGMPDDLKGYKTLPGVHNTYTGFLAMLGTNYFNMDTMKKDVYQNPYKYAYRPESTMATLPVIPPTENKGNIESCPDVFYFSFGKHSGKFMINYDGSISVIGYNGGKYQVDLSGMKLLDSTSSQNTYIRILTDDGYVYTFGGDGYASLEYTALAWKGGSISNPDSEIMHNEITAFHLTQIKAPNGRILNIHYRDIGPIYHQFPTRLIDLNQGADYAKKTDLLTQYLLSGKRTAVKYNVIENKLNFKTNPPMYGETDGTLKNSYSLTKVALIDRIEVDGCTIHFYYSARSKHTIPVGDMKEGFFLNSGAKLDSVEMKYNQIKEIARFKYDFNWGNRMFLSTVSTTCEGTHSFKYYLPNVPEIPTPLTGNIDHWNFWRGRDKNAGLIPGMTQEGDNQLDFEFTTNDRDATGKDFDATQLEQITYPTGGSVQFIYEPHRYSYISKQTEGSSYYPSLEFPSLGRYGWAGGARIHLIRYFDANGKEQREIEYTYGKDLNEGEVMYIPFYKYLRIEPNFDKPGQYVVKAVSYNSDGFSDVPYPSTHIRYPEVTEHYLDPSKGGIEQEHSYKITYFQGYLQNLSWYTDNAFFTPLKSCAQNEYEMAENYKTFLKHLVAHPTEDLIKRYGKISKEVYYNENGKMQKCVEYKYQYNNSDKYGLCIFTPSFPLDIYFGLFTHIAQESFRTFVPVSKRTVIYQGSQEEAKVQMEYFSYSENGYLKEQVMVKNNGDSLITWNLYGNYSTSSGFQILPTDRKLYLGTSHGRKILKSYNFSYRPLEVLSGWRQYFNVLARELQLDENYKPIERIDYNYYDKYGNILEKVENNSKHTVFLWSHYGQNPRARIENATYQEVSSVLGCKLEDLSALTVYTPILDNDFRIKLPCARVFTYWCNQRNSITTSTAPNGQSTYYTYDKRGRLIQTYQLNEEGRMEILQLNNYHIVNE